MIKPLYAFLILLAITFFVFYSFFCDVLQAGELFIRQASSICFFVLRFIFNNLVRALFGK